MNSQLNFVNFTKLFETNDYSKINQIRKDLKTIPFEWKDQQSITTNLDDFYIKKKSV